MRYVCDAPGGKTWFRLETEVEAADESRLMRHAVAIYFCNAKDKATLTYQPTSQIFFEQEIGLKAHVQREMPVFLTLRDGEGNALATAMLPPGGRENGRFIPVIVGLANGDPYSEHGEAIRMLGEHFGLKLERSRCYLFLAGLLK
jgi:hypothetical protein